MNKFSKKNVSSRWRSLHPKGQGGRQCLLVFGPRPKWTKSDTIWTQNPSGRWRCPNGWPTSARINFFQGYVMDIRICSIEERPTGQNTTRSTQTSRTQLHAAYSRTTRKKETHSNYLPSLHLSTRVSSALKSLQPSIAQLHYGCCAGPQAVRGWHFRKQCHSDDSKGTNNLGQS
jgi:hypothetical protein